MLIELADQCDHPGSRRRTIIRSRLGTVELCEKCGKVLGDEELDALDRARAGERS